MDIIFKNVSKSFADKKVLDNFNAVFEEKKLTLLTGVSGSGKSTVLNIILDIIRPDEGDVIIDRDKKISAVFQEDRLVESLSLKANIDLVLDCKTKEETLESYLSSFCLSVPSNVKIRELSGGMKRRVSILRALASQPDILVFDEAFSGLDDATAKKVLSHVIENMKGKTIIASTHNEKLFSQYDYNLINVKKL